MQGRRGINFRTLILYLKRLTEALQQLLLRKTIQIAHNTVIVDNAQLRSGERNSQEVAILLLARMRGILRHTLLTHASGSSRTVVTIGNVERRHLGKELGQATILLRRAYHPEVVAKAIGGGEIVVGLVMFYNILNDGVNLVIVGVGEEYGLDVGLLVANVNHTILLLIGARKLVLLDCTREVILKVTTHCNTILRATSHCLRIDVVVLLLVLLEPSTLLPQAEVLNGFIVNLSRMLVGNGVEVDFGFDDVQQRALRSLGLGLGGIQHIVGS